MQNHYCPYIALHNVVKESNNNMIIKAYLISQLIRFKPKNVTKEKKNYKEDNLLYPDIYFLSSSSVDLSIKSLIIF